MRREMVVQSSKQVGLLRHAEIESAVLTFSFEKEEHVFERQVNDRCLVDGYDVMAWFDTGATSGRVAIDVADHMTEIDVRLQ